MHFLATQQQGLKNVSSERKLKVTPCRCLESVAESIDKLSKKIRRALFILLGLIWIKFNIFVSRHLLFTGTKQCCKRTHSSKAHSTWFCLKNASLTVRFYATACNGSFEVAFLHPTCVNLCCPHNYTSSWTKLPLSQLVNNGLAGYQCVWLMYCLAINRLIVWV